MTEKHTLESPGYERLADVLHRAFSQASEGKGKERHANALPFHEQPMQQIARRRGIGFILGQADKKSEEAQGMLERGDTDACVRELLGSIVYLAGAIIHIEDRRMLHDAHQSTVEFVGFAKSVADAFNSPQPIPDHFEAVARRESDRKPKTKPHDAPDWAVGEGFYKGAPVWTGKVTLSFKSAPGQEFSRTPHCDDVVVNETIFKEN